VHLLDINNEDRNMVITGSAAPAPSRSIVTYIIPASKAPAQTGMADGQVPVKTPLHIFK
jgi:hypothetical protein